MSNDSAFSANGIKAAIKELIEEIQELYLSDSIPWAIGYSGGKDSTAVVQLVWMALEQLPAEKLHKDVHVMTTDTMVENPIVSTWVSTSLNTMSDVAKKKGLPIKSHLLTPEIQNTFWVNLIGKGYPAPRHKFRWCTERLKIKPSNKFIEDVVCEHGEVILLLGVRSAESSARAASIKRRKINPHDRLTSHIHMHNCLVFSPIETWTNDDVWAFLLRFQNPWEYNNKDLLNMYRGATEDNECPIVVDTSTPSCGNSRFGCWVCTLVSTDKSMTAMIQNDDEKEWMLPMLKLRDDFEISTDEGKKRDRERRDFRRLSGQLSYYKDKEGEVQLVPGPYTQSSRADWLRKLLQTQMRIRNNKNAPELAKKIELITLDELQEIRRIWLLEKHEVEDLVPAIYGEVLGQDYPGDDIDEALVFDSEILELLKECCGDESDLIYELSRNLLDIERRYRTLGARRGLFSDLEKEVKKCFFSDSVDAKDWVQRKAELKDKQFVPDDGRFDDFIVRELKSGLEIQ
mgnify:CR=1 FL=1